MVGGLRRHAGLSVLTEVARQWRCATRLTIAVEPGARTAISLEGSPKAAKTSDNGLIGNVLGILLFAFGLASARLPGRGDIEYLPAHLPYRAPWRVTYGPRIHLIDRGSSDGPKVR
jgi:hypothetical protein